MTCKEVATRLDADTAAGEPLRTRIELRLHLMMCRHCRRFRRQLSQLRTGIDAIRSMLDAEASARGLEERIANAVDSNDGSDRRP